MDNTPSRRERDQQRHRQEILDAAKVVFADLGFEDATMRKIAAAAEFSLASVYKHFESKEQLYQSLLAEHVVRYLKELDEAVATVKSPIEKIKTSIRVSIKNLNNETELSQLLLRDLRGLSASGGEMQTANSAYRAVLGHYEGLFRLAGAEGEICDVDPTDAALCLVGTLYIWLVYGLFIEPKHPLDAEKMLRVVLGAIEDPNRAKVPSTP